MRESPALDIIELLHQKGADVGYHDPFVSEFAHNGHIYRSKSSLIDALEIADCIVVVTDHSVYDWSQLNRLTQSVVDTRNVVQPDLTRKVIQLTELL